MDRRGRSRRGASAAESMAALTAAAAADEGAENGTVETPFDEDVKPPTLGGDANGSASAAPTAAVPVSARRGPPVGNGGGGGPSCQADRCGVDLTDAKVYHRRHKVCAVHAKAPVVIVAGLQQRFCQQCSRFHELSEFDDIKRSCRRRLAGHNERRRKSPADSHGGGGGRGGGGGGTAGGGACRHADQGGRLPGNPPLIR